MTENSILSSTDDAATAIAALRDDEETQSLADDNLQADESQTEEQAAEGADAEPDQEDDLDPASGDHDAEGEPDDSPVNAAPASWPKDRIDAWNDLTPAAQQVFLEREGEVHSALSDKGREAAEARREAQEATNRVTDQYQDRINRLNQLLPTLVQNFKSKYEQIDWVRLADEDPDSYTRLRAQADEERGQIETAAAETQYANAQAEAAFQAQQFETLLARNPQYGTQAGRKLLAEEARDVEAFALGLEGVTPDQLKMVSAPVYEALRDAIAVSQSVNSSGRPGQTAGATGGKTRRPPQPVGNRPKDPVRRQSKIKGACQIRRRACSPGPRTGRCNRRQTKDKLNGSTSKYAVVLSGRRAPKKTCRT